MPTVAAGKGLEGIVAANSGICYIDGDAGVLAYRGIDIHELAENSTFEEMQLTCFGMGFCPMRWNCASFFESQLSRWPVVLDQRVNLS